MVVETGVIIAGTGYAGSAIARALTDPKNNAPFILLDKRENEMLLDVILSESGEVAGALVSRPRRVDAEVVRHVVEPIRAPAVVLATGNVAGLFPGGEWTHSGDGLAIAHRAGLALSKPHVVDGQLRSGVPCKDDGSTGLAGLFAAGSLGQDRPDAAKVARAAILRSREGSSAFGPYHHHSSIDSPLPAGFARVKFERLQGVMSRALDGTLLRDQALMELHRLKGEADEFARARVDVELFSLQNACEVAILLLKAA